MGRDGGNCDSHGHVSFFPFSLGFYAFCYAASLFPRPTACLGKESVIAEGVGEEGGTLPSSVDQ